MTTTNSDDSTDRRLELFFSSMLETGDDEKKEETEEVPGSVSSPKVSALIQHWTKKTSPRGALPPDLLSPRSTGPSNSAPPAQTAEDAPLPEYTPVSAVVSHDADEQAPPSVNSSVTEEDDEETKEEETGVALVVDDDDSEDETENRFQPGYLDPPKNWSPRKVTGGEARPEEAFPRDDGSLEEEASRAGTPRPSPEKAVVASPEQASSTLDASTAGQIPACYDEEAARPVEEALVSGKALKEAEPTVDDEQKEVSPPDGLEEDAAGVTTSIEAADTSELQPPMMMAAPPAIPGANSSITSASTHKSAALQRFSARAPSPEASAAQNESATGQIPACYDEEVAQPVEEALVSGKTVDDEPNLEKEPSDSLEDAGVMVADTSELQPAMMAAPPPPAIPGANSSITSASTHKSAALQRFSARSTPQVVGGGTSQRASRSDDIPKQLVIVGIAASSSASAEKKPASRPSDIFRSRTQETRTDSDHSGSPRQFDNSSLQGEATLPESAAPLDATTKEKPPRRRLSTWRSFLYTRRGRWSIVGVVAVILLVLIVSISVLATRDSGDMSSGADAPTTNTTGSVGDDEMEGRLDETLGKIDTDSEDQGDGASAAKPEGVHSGRGASDIAFNTANSTFEALLGNSSVVLPPSHPFLGDDDEDETPHVPVTDVVGAMGTAAPAPTPSAVTATSHPTVAVDQFNVRRRFQSTPELYAAVDAYLASGGAFGSEVALEYGWPIGNWDVSAIVDFSRLFQAKPSPAFPEARNPLAVDFNEDISLWDFSSATDLTAMMYGVAAFDQDVSGWNVERVQVLDDLFAECTSFDGDVSSWDTSQVMSLVGTFDKATAFTGKGIENWNVERVVDFSYLFYEATSFQGDLSSWTTTSAVYMTAMLYGAELFASDISGFDVSNVQDFKFFLYGAFSFRGDLSSWQMGQATSLQAMFLNAASFDSAIGQWDVSKATDLSGCFLGASSFNQDLSQWDVSSVVNFDFMFDDAASFSQDLCAWGPHAAANSASVDDMFKGTSCPTLDNPFFPASDNQFGSMAAGVPGPFCFPCF